MKKLLLIAGIVLILAGILSLLFALLNLAGYNNVLDGSADLYSRMHQRMIIFFVIGIVITAIGAVCVTAHFKL
ncbi:MAG: hypothetical protein IJU45_03905 [Clostridia bacterium]|nr:hypothetical protein [Clostridia bacterium]